MKVELNGKTYVVTFRYRDEINTYCVIRELNSKRVEAVGHARRRKTDHYDKELARKFSLEDALANADRSDRAAFWSVFTARQKWSACKLRMHAAPTLSWGW